ncbi:MAG: glycosyl hydrolase 53 family protein [Saprospiraceae bacterium]|nr:glycosyl hydrolase 53 family protein [Saprospiraceae bacterium]
MRKALALVLSVILSLSCHPSKAPEPAPEPPEAVAFIAAADISSYPEIEMSQPVFYAEDGRQAHFLDILKAGGVNTIRLRLWVNPGSAHSGLEEVEAFARRLRAMGFRLWLALHYSDTWADPGRQEMPARWRSLDFARLKDSVREYTRNVTERLRPEFIQIGNEINSGFLHPAGHLTQNPQQFRALLSAAAQAVRAASPGSKILLHFAGLENAPAFFQQQVAGVDYDIIALSYYPIWHGKDLALLQAVLRQLGQRKPVVIAETAYPFTLGWNDWTTNIVGLPEQLILPDYPATPQGQWDFLRQIRRIVRATPGGLGFCYWGAEWIAWKGPTATDGSPWENQALFDFDHRALPVLRAFRED